MRLEPASSNSIEAGDNDNGAEDFVEVSRPRTRGDCINGPRPCPWISCRHHLYFSAIKRNLHPAWPGLEPDEMSETCSLDVADRSETTLADIARLMNLSRERVRQLESDALAKYLKNMKRLNDE